MKLKSSILILALLVSTLAVAVPMARAVVPQFQFDPDPVIANVGTEVKIQIRLDTVGSFNAWEATIRWNKNVLQYKGITWGWLAEDIGDFNDDYVVDSTDLGIMGSVWGMFDTDPGWLPNGPVADLDPTGNIDSTDLGILGAHWGHFKNMEVTELAVLDPIGNALSIYEGFNDPALEVPGSTPFLMATVKFLVLSGGISNLEFLDYEHIWGAGAVLIPCTTNDGYLYTLQPFVDFTMTPANSATFNYKGARAGETITFNGSASSSADGDTITGYSWSIDGGANGTAVTTTGSFATYSKTAHDVALTVSDSGGHSYTLHKPYTVNRDISIFSIWPSMEDYQGSIQFSFVSGKYVVILVRIANIGTITEYTDNTFGDFPSTARLQLWWIHEDGTEEKIYEPSSGTRIRRYWNYTAGAAALTRLYDWQPVVGVSHWKFFDLWGATPETGCYFKANFTDSVSGLYPFDGDTDASNNELMFGPFNITAGFDHDTRIEGVWTYDSVGYYLPVQPFGTTFKYGYGQKFYGIFTGAPGPFDPMPPGTISNVTVAISNVGINDETVTWHVYAAGTEIYNSTDVLDTITGYFEFTFGWNTTLFPGLSTLTVYVEPVAGETDPAGFPWATWDNNTPENRATYGLTFFNAYDDWVIQSSYP
jgi:hypothetical protein